MRTTLDDIPIGTPEQERDLAEKMHQHGQDMFERVEKYKGLVDQYDSLVGKMESTIDLRQRTHANTLTLVDRQQASWEACERARVFWKGSTIILAATILFMLIWSAA